MSEADRGRWDQRYRAAEPISVDEITLPAVFRPHAERFPTAGIALDVACGRGGHSVWLARRGLRVRGIDASSVAIAQAGELARSVGLAGRCEFAVVDLDDGLSPGPQVDILLCNMFRDHRLDAAMVARIKPGGLLAISVLSAVGAQSGPFRVEPGELTRAFADLRVIDEGESAGRAWLLASRDR